MQVQEKIYIHTDNLSYFVGDTIWYKAYVLRADDLRPTDMSKILYVELLTPDGYLVERQRIIIDHDTQSFGQFALPDSMYSGFYEMRAYTRWQLNFNDRIEPHDAAANFVFVNPQYADEYFRTYDGLYRRVFPIYEKNKEAGNFSDRWILERPKRRLVKENLSIDVHFFPEGGSIVKGLKNRIAFEVLDTKGCPLAINGMLDDGTILHTNSNGRGIFEITPSDTAICSARFMWQGEERSFTLPATQAKGATLTFNPEKNEVMASANGTDIGALSATCRGRLVHFTRNVNNAILTDDLPTGVNEIVAYDTTGTPLAVRQIFVNHNDIGRKIALNLSDSLAVKPFQRLDLKTDTKPLKTASIAVSDRRGDEPTYDDGNILTDLLLSGDLRGFVAHPAQYFEADDVAHRQKIDLLLMIQGWKKYTPPFVIRYQPETHLTIEGSVAPNSNIYEEDLIRYIHDNCPDFHNPCFYCDKAWLFETKTIKKRKGKQHTIDTITSPEQKKILVEAELVKGDDIVGETCEIDENGNFRFHVPPFYGKATLHMTAYHRHDSIRQCLSSTTDEHKYNPLVSPYFIIKVNRFNPMQATPYDWHETHNPIDWEETQYGTESDSTISGGNLHILDNVTVKTRRRRGLRRFDPNKPALVCDFGQLYNDIFDYGLHTTSTFNAIMFWVEASHYLFANCSSREPIRIRASIDGHYFIKPTPNRIGTMGDAVGEPMTAVTLNRILTPQNIGPIRIYTDFDRRNKTGKEENRLKADVWFDISSIKGEDSQRILRRDRRMVIDGIAYPEQFYHRDYSGAALPDSADYRRTLYWNPNAHPDKDGNLDIQFYNGARPAHLKVTMCGVGEDGQIYYY